MTTQEEPTYLVADLGGTNIRLGRVAGDELLDVEHLQCRKFEGIAEVLRHYLGAHDFGPSVLCLAVASPVQGDIVQMTNLDWRFSRQGLKQELGLVDLLVINDYTATAMSVPFLLPAHKHQVGLGSPREDEPIAVCGPGTGLGVAHMVWHLDRWLVLDGEGGHIDFAATDEVEQKIHNIFQRRYGHVSVERILSGPGLAELYQALCEIRHVQPEALGAEEISARAVAGSCELCLETLRRFCAMLGSFCGNLALTLATFGGVYIAGGIIPDILDFFSHSDFRQRFEAKGRYQAYNSAIPTYVITAPSPGLSGAAAYLHQHLRLNGDRP